MSINFLVLPGIGNSDENHWQTLWELEDSNFQRIQQEDWNNPLCEDWINQLEVAVKKLGGRTILVAHSLSCLLIAHWAATTKLPITGALLVAPPNPRSPAFPQEALSFDLVPQEKLQFKTIVVASDNDPYADIEFSRHCATSWGSELVCMPNAGHINSSSGFGEWPQGKLLLKSLVTP